MNIAYLYAGERVKKTGDIHADYPDTPLYGANHLAQKEGVHVAQIGVNDIVRSRRVRKLLGFRTLHILGYFYTVGFDVVIGSALLYPLVLKRLLYTKPRYLLLNFAITRLLESNQKGIVHMLMRFALNGSHAIVCMARVQQEYLQRVFPDYKGIIAHIPLGTDVEYYKPVFEGREDFILSAGRDNGRDYGTVIAAAKAMPDRKFLIVCSRRNLAGIDDMPENVEVRFDVPPEELRDLYRRARLMLLITHDDSFGEGSDCSGQTVLLDAMASGLPVVASRKRYIHEYVADGEEALLTDFYSVQDIQEKIGILDDSSHANGIARAARAKVERYFSTRIMADHLYALIQKVTPSRV